MKDRAVYLTAHVVAAVEQYLAVRGPALSDHLFIYRHKPLSKDLVRNRLRAAGERLGFRATPHMLRHILRLRSGQALRHPTGERGLPHHDDPGAAGSRPAEHDDDLCDGRD